MWLLRSLKALADETRLRMINVLSVHELNVNELVRVMEVGQSGISRHLKILSDSGLVAVRRDGLRAFYRVLRNPDTAVLLDAVSTLGRHEEQLTEDLSRAARVLEERREETRAFFASVPSFPDSPNRLGRLSTARMAMSLRSPRSSRQPCWTTRREML